ncbi:MerR family transcriptional regulator [Rhodococcus sp. BP-149]|nr:MerR family transcriptional regulator [Rhodococcus sp. BP-288]MBY6692574.1 MerR family transcriptional regulator [Rhodococcus sp. BP-188]MBY6698472.1 MerR family transcriptional regulator [Rhodococcus sp. BP-285]MBY6701151.1 MerR family transcriptional regulator [Rhodococcus sp. BP-283]MBY6712152.1 MerR family transcriptional regulator [Rhodococcus sp. BP-160]MBY6718059.1 MerR family transcriptional regulator [Rhodococcus sp. BP-110]MBY6720224.1 MerR family transcriptional regulator [Rhodo
MRMSELVERSGVPRPTIKFYLREGLLMPGVGAATVSEYTDEHLDRLRLIKALTGASLPLGRIRTVLAALDEATGDVHPAMSRALGALPPYLDDAGHDGLDQGPAPRTSRILERLGHAAADLPTDSSAARQLDHSLAAADAAGVPLSDDDVVAYARAVRVIAEGEWARVLDHTEPRAAVRFAVLGTVLYEPVVTALRRLAHHDLAQQHFAPTGSPDQLTRATSGLPDQLTRPASGLPDRPHPTTDSSDQ